ncbi:sodium-dependent glucose transporter 1A-like protein, partial [Dinothrombium tinctorium]
MSAVQEIKNNKVNFIKTVLFSFIYSVIGVSMSIIGPSLLDLQIAVGATINQISYLLPVRAFGYVIGSFSGSFIPKKSDTQIYVLFCTVAVALTTASLPWNRGILTILVNAGFSGYFMGLLEIFYCLHKEYTIHPSLKTGDKKSEEKSSLMKTISIISIISLPAIFMHLYFGNTLTFAGFLSTFSVKSKLNLSKSKGAFMTSIF